MPPDLQCQIKAHETHYGKELDCTPVVSCSFEHHTSDSTMWLVSTPILRKTLWRWSSAPHLFSPSNDLTRGLAAQLLFRYIGKSGEIANGIKEVVDLARQINLEVHRICLQELLDSHNRKQTIAELIELHEQQQDIEELGIFRPSSIKRLNDV
ncbi:hypothetical protein TNCV_2045471 [Trichonephila clavipes]|uniref:Uncharacterized protein n=1 Tax=Trichonephila clavipes TaxID=2585209 RepID=A0A8X6VLX4_TRICX|nr:hypothetical protein TNCV_2045471 [Trichonephila clavipes]